MKNSHLIPHVPQQSNSICSREWHEEREGQVSCDWKPDVNNGVSVNADGDGQQPDQDASSKLWHFQNPILHQDWGKATWYRIDWKEVFTTYPKPWFWFYCGLLSICSFSLTECQQWSSSNWPRLQLTYLIRPREFQLPLAINYNSGMDKWPKSEQLWGNNCVEVSGKVHNSQWESIICSFRQDVFVAPLFWTATLQSWGGLASVWGQ